MIISQSQGFIFIAVPKTGTSSIEQALALYDSARLSSGFNKHVLAMKLAEEIDPGLWQRCFKFAFVREPVAWMYSWYRYRQRGDLQDPEHRFHHRYTGDKSFDEFIHSFADHEIFLKQSDFIGTHTGELLVDFVGRYENLQADYDSACARIDVPAIRLPRVNASDSNTGGKIEISVASRQIIEEYFARDFELFGYS